MTAAVSRTLPLEEALAQAVAHHQAGRLQEAEGLYRAILQAQPAHPDANHNLGVLAMQLGQCAAGLPYLKSALSAAPGNGQYWLSYADALQALGQLDEAVASYRQALALKPDYAEACNNLGVALQAQGQLDEAVESYRRVLAIRPEFAEAHCNLGNALQAQGKLDEAAASYRRAFALKPDYAVAHYNLGVVLQAQGQFEEAVASYRQALAIKPDFAQAHGDLGNALQAQGKLDEAMASYRRALDIRPDYAEAHSNLGIAQQARGQLDDALASYRRALALKPDYADAHYNLGNALREFGQLDDAVTSYRRALALKPDFALAHSNLLFALNYHPDASGEEILALSREYDAKFFALWRSWWPSHRNSREPGRRLRIGYVSPDFRRHAVAYFAEPILARHERSQVEIFCYAEVKREDDYSERFRGMAEHWHNTVGLSDEAMAQLIQAHQIDILVDLAGHSANNRLRVFARKPAPVQATYLGYPGTTGLAAMDYRITDRHTDPEGLADAHYVERLVRLPESLWCFRPAPDMPEPTPLPALSRGYVTYGSFNNCSKIDRPTVELWAALLREQPEARLMLFTVPQGEIRQHLLRGFAEHGVEPERLILHERLSATEFHRKILEVDIALDPVTVNGGTTTCESLWLGVPVISLTGTRFLSRAGLSFLNTIGMSDWAAASKEEYLRIAARFARDLPLLADIRRGLRPRMAASPLTDEVAFTHHLEAAYRQMWARWCSGGGEPG